MNNQAPNFGDIFFAELPKDEHVQGGIRPVVIAQNNKGNLYSPTVEILPMSSQVWKASHLPTHVVVLANVDNGLNKDSIVLTEQVRTINMGQLIKRVGSLTHGDLVRIGRARSIQSPFPAS